MSDRIALAKSAGFCFGVNRAVSMIYEKVGEGHRVCTLGPIIHNPQVIDDLGKKGVLCVEKASDVPDGYELIIRTHGISKEQEQEVIDSGVTYINAACPFVTKIHNLIKKYSTPDSVFLIAGDEKHPEVCGFRSHCLGSSFVFRNIDELEKIFLDNDIKCQKKVFCLAQTTFSIDEWKKSSEFLKKVCTNAILFDTICLATDERQKEAARLAAVSDLMIVIGGRFSSNTSKLYEVCSRYCETLLVETAEELKNKDFSQYRSIGVTAGASTPAGIIKEVLFTMSENLNEQTTTNPVSEEISFADALEENLSRMSSEKRVVGIVVGISSTEIQVDIGRKHAGFVKREDYSDDPNADPAKELKIGDKINLIIMKTNDAEGTVMLSKRLYDAGAAWEKLAAAKEEGTVLEGTVAEVVKGGLRVFTNGVRVFVPASHATLRRTDDLQSLLKKPVRLEIIEVNTATRRAVGSIRNVIKRERDEAAAALRASLEVGQSYTGTVKSLMSFGAFVDIGGIDGMVHISELSWGHIKHPSDVVNVGDVITVYVKGFDEERKKISLGYKRDEDNPWVLFTKGYKEGDIVEVKVTHLASFGAFAEIIPNVEGLIHISQIADRRIEKVSDALKAGDTVKALITGIDTENHHISLSIRALIAPAEEPVAEDDEAEDDGDGLVYSTDAPEAFSDVVEQLDNEADAE